MISNSLDKISILFTVLFTAGHVRTIRLFYLCNKIHCWWVHDKEDGRVPSTFILNRLQTGHWVDYYIILYRVHVLITVRCQRHGCGLKNKEGAVGWQPIGQLTASRHTILEIAISYCCCTHSLVILGPVNVDFIMWFLSAVIFIGFD